MAKRGPKRTKLQRERDQATVARMRLRGYTQQEIAEAVGCSRQQVSHDMKLIEAQWRESTLRDHDQLKAQALAQVQAVRAEYWQAWERSQEARRRQETERTGTGEAGRNKARVVTEEQIGDPRFLQGVERTIEQEARLMGLEAPRKVAPTNPEGTEPYEPMTDDERARRLVGILAADAGRSAQLRRILDTAGTPGAGPDPGGPDESP